MTVNSTRAAPTLLGQLDGLLETLKTTSAGTGVYDQLKQLLDEWQRAREITDRTHATMFAFLLETCHDQLDDNALMELNANLVRARHEAANFSPDLDKTAVKSRSVSSRMDSDAISGDIDTLCEQSRVLRESADLDAADASGESTNLDSPMVERRVSSVYQNHLDRKHNEIEKIQDGLEVEAKAAIAQNKEFGALLATELAALEQIDDIGEIEALKDILIGGTRELLQGQKKLEENLTGSLNYMDLVRSDSEGLRDELNKVRLLSLTDDFTGLSNRRAFMRRLEDEIGRAHRYGSPLTLAMIDLDYFKQINDKYGHAAGDDVLKWYASEPLAIFRHYDLVARYGGEEFSVLLPSTDEVGARRALEKVARHVVENKSIDCKGETIDIPTFSAGLAVYNPGEDMLDFIDRADKALYRAKNNGRNCVESQSGASQAGSLG
ncbi:MAG: GGDEF domain-containing protein [Proteobacteria bacterium]|nr:GGDEF domain-containing protein [Pseudomonadota bacterium]